MYKERGHVTGSDSYTKKPCKFSLSNRKKKWKSSVGKYKEGTWERPLPMLKGRKRKGGSAGHLFVRK